MVTASSLGSHLRSQREDFGRQVYAKSPDEVLGRYDTGGLGVDCQELPANQGSTPDVEQAHAHRQKPSGHDRSRGTARPVSRH